MNIKTFIVSTWDRLHSLTPNFNFLKLKTTLQQVQLSTESLDLVYYDAFAPSKQPELWTFPSVRKNFSAH